MNEVSTAEIFELPSNDKKLINIPQESFKDEIPFEPANSTKKSNWFLFKKEQKEHPTPSLHEIVNILEIYKFIDL